MFSTLSYSVRLAKSKDIGGNQDKISRLLFWQLSFTSLGVIYGDIGTSPLYVLNSVLADALGTDSNGNINTPSESDSIGAVSLIFWTLVIFVCIKYVVFILMADNHGEGGTFALYALLRSRGNFGKPARAALAIFSMLGAAFVMGDGALTPAVSILSSIEGILIVKPDFTPYVVPITIVIVILLFIFQRFGTTKVGYTFSPIIVLWFLSILVVGIYNITFAPHIFVALNPGAGVEFIIRYGYSGFICLGSVFLAVTGLEALYADLGHFSANPIRLSWLSFAFPALALNYIGQGAYLLNNPSGVSNPFFNSVPTPAFWLLFVLSLLATIIASQAMITGTYSLVSQAIMLDFFPRVTIVHKSKKVYGQIYIPEINWILMILTIAIVAGFGTSSTITHAYGVTVCSVMVETTILYAFVIHRVWHKHWILSVLFGVIFLSIDSFFLAANYTKIPTGGYVSIIFAAFWFLTMLIWYLGEKRRARFQKTVEKTSGKQLRDILANNQLTVKTDLTWEAQVRRLSKENSNLDGRSHSSSSAGELMSIRKLTTLEGTGIFFTTSRKGVPRSLTEVSKIISALPQVLVLMNLRLEKKPYVEENKMVVVKEYSPRLFRVKVNIGYMQTKLRMSTLLQQCYDQGLPQDNRITIWTEDETIFIGPQNFVTKFIYTVYRFYKNIFKTSEIQIRLPPQSVFNVSIVEIL